MGLTKVFDLFVGGTPLPEPRHRTYTDKRTGRIICTRDKSADAWINTLIFFWRKLIPNNPYDGCLKIRTVYYFKKPKYVKEEEIYKKTKPDGDNLYKLVADQLEKIGFVFNDSRFVDIRIIKYYKNKKNAEGARIQIWKL